METFAVIVLVIIVVSIQHLVNWMWRWDSKNNTRADISLLFIVLTTISIFISWACIYHIILWGYPIISGK